MIERGQMIDVRLKTRLHCCRYGHRLKTQRLQDVPVGRIPGRGQRDAVAMIERSQERQHEGSGRTGRDDDTGGIDLDAVHRPIVTGDAATEVADAQGLSVSKLMAVQCALGRGNNG